MLLDFTTVMLVLTVVVSTILSVIALKKTNIR